MTTTVASRFMVSGSEVTGLEQLSSSVIFFPNIRLHASGNSAGVRIVLVFSSGLSLSRLMRSFGMFGHSTRGYRSGREVC